jgi:hypothetical protein
MSDYWRPRANLNYYNVARSMVYRHCQGGTLLDVGGAVGLGCKYLSEYHGFDKTSVELSGGTHTLPDVRVIQADFLKWSQVVAPVASYDAVICLQVLEHLEDPRSFAAQLFLLARKVVVISVPYQWLPGECPGHVQDPVDRVKLQSWTRRTCFDAQIVDRRLVACYPMGEAQHGD